MELASEEYRKEYVPQDFCIRFMDGTPVPQDYQDMVGQLVHECAVIEEQIGIDELEWYAMEQRGLRDKTSDKDYGDQYE